MPLPYPVLDAAEACRTFYTLLLDKARPEFKAGVKASIEKGGDIWNSVLLDGVLKPEVRYYLKSAEPLAPVFDEHGDCYQVVDARIIVNLPGVGSMGAEQYRRASIAFLEVLGDLETCMNPFVGVFLMKMYTASEWAVKQVENDNYSADLAIREILPRVVRGLAVGASRRLKDPFPLEVTYLDFGMGNPGVLRGRSYTVENVEGAGMVTRIR